MSGSRTLISAATVLLLLQLVVPAVTSPVSGELHSFPYHLRDVFLFDKEVAGILRHIVPPTPESERYLESYAGTILDAMTAGGDVLDEAILGNPLQVFALIKRMVLYWPRLKDAVYNTTKAKERCHDKTENCDAWIRERGCDAQHVDTICSYSCGFCQVEGLYSTVPTYPARTYPWATSEPRTLARWDERLACGFITTGSLQTVSDHCKPKVYVHNDPA
nr:uncharacterized protein LOC113811500 [Penaeus vannamei]